MAQQALILLLLSFTALAQMPPRTISDLQLLASVRNRSAAAYNGNTNGIVAYWSLEDQNWLDSSGNSRDLSEQGTITNAIGLVGNCAGFDLTAANYLRVNDEDAFSAINSNSLTVTAWMKPGTTNALMAIVSKLVAVDGQREWYLYSDSTPRLRFYIYTNAASTAIGPTITRNFVIGNWYFLSGIIDETNKVVKLRIGDGADLGAWTSVSYMGFGPDMKGTNTTARVSIGSRNGGSPFDGLIDEIGIWSRVLSDSEITNIFNAGNGKAWPLTP